ncbi:PEGA domain-containing protein [Candidatus Methanocrinis natronophilus]|uniref:PEGA domain-containing protein n=1 Tax=Candidatus Methanocrinis natronophilus TaxID=3033396 RepID=A0ABT5X7S2_9EURY|nr:PEGA domain-containing protein [Candidatus Methanocrinis natronophilus]MDF0590726.1 PEGA domain-containing protein [Candidatus Methanocrinis natronophilus]
MGTLIRQLLSLAFLLILSAAMAPAAVSYESGGSETINLGSGPRPIYRIGYYGEGPVDIDELIDRAQSSLAPGRVPSDEMWDPASHLPEEIGKASTEETEATGPAPASEDAPKEGLGSDLSWRDPGQIEEKRAPYVRVPVVSDPPGAEVYINGIFYGVTPFLATVVPDSHLVEVHLHGHWNWFNVVDFSDATRSVAVTLTPRWPATVATAETDPGQDVSDPMGDRPSVEDASPANSFTNVTTPSGRGDDFWEENYRKLLIVVAFLSFLIGSGSIATWARSRLTNSVKISFPRDGEDRWGGLVEGQSSRIRGTKKQLYVLVRCDDDQLQVAKRLEPNRDGRWSTRCDAVEGTVYRIYAVMVDRPLKEGDLLEEIPSHRAISEVGPVTGRARSPKPPDR